MADFTHEINENLQLNLSMNVEQLDANSLTRESYGSIRVRDTVTEDNYNSQPNGTQYIRTFWTKNDISTDRIGSRSCFGIQKRMVQRQEPHNRRLGLQHADQERTIRGPSARRCRDQSITERY